MATSLQQMFPGLTTADAQNLALGGLTTTATFTHMIETDMNLLGSYDSTILAYSTGAKGIKCN